MNIELLNGRQFAQRFPIGDAPERAWYYHLQRLRAAHTLLEGKHWCYQEGCDGQPVRVYRVESVLKALARERRSSHPSMFVIALFRDHLPAVESAVKSARTENPTGNSPDMP